MINLTSDRLDFIPTSTTLAMIQDFQDYVSFNIWVMNMNKVWRRVAINKLSRDMDEIRSLIDNYTTAATHIKKHNEIKRKLDNYQLPNGVVIWE